MIRIENRWIGFGRHLGNAIFVNFLSGFISAGAYLIVIKLLGNTISDQPTIKLVAIVSAIVFWCISYGLAVLGLRHSKPFRKNLKYLGYYFPLTTLFVWAFDQRSIRLKAEEKLRRLEKIVEGWPDIRIIAGIIDPQKQKDTLNKIIDNVDYMEEHTLAQILENIRRYAESILVSVGESGIYDFFRQLMEKVSLSEPGARPETYQYFLWLLSDIYRMPPKGCFTRPIQKDMIGALKKAIWRVDQPNLSLVGMIIKQIMSDEEDEQDLARQILDMLLYLDWREKREVWQIIFDESKKRAFRFPQGFGFDFLNMMSQLEHKVFWLDIQSLRDILVEAIKNGDRGLINLKRKVYEELCSKVFSPLEFEEDDEHAGIRNARVFRRLSGMAGKVMVECVLPNGKKCCCEGENLSFRGFYSETCPRKTGEKMKAKVTPEVEVDQSKPKHAFVLSASVAKTHPFETSAQSTGRGIFFEDAEEDAVKSLYDYISEHRK